MRRNIIVKSCSQDWEKMEKIENSINRNCSTCSKMIYNISDLTDNEAFNLKQNNGNSICVKSDFTQIRRLREIEKFNKRAFYTKMGIVGLLVLGNLINNNVFAQSIEKNPNFKVTQVESENDFFEVKGKAKYDRKYKMKDRVTDVYIYDENKKLIKSLKTNKNGVFKITLDKKDFKEKMIITFSFARQVRQKEITNLDFKNIKLKVKFGYSRLITPGYF